MKNTLQMYKKTKIIRQMPCAFCYNLILFQNFVISFKDCLHFFR